MFNALVDITRCHRQLDAGIDRRRTHQISLINPPARYVLGSRRISPPRFLAECGKSRRLNQGSFAVGLFFVVCFLSFFIHVYSHKPSPIYNVNTKQDKKCRTERSYKTLISTAQKFKLH